MIDAQSSFFVRQLYREVAARVHLARLLPGQIRLSLTFGVPEGEGWNAEAEHYRVEVDLWFAEDFPRQYTDDLRLSCDGMSTVGFAEARDKLLPRIDAKLPALVQRVAEDERYKARVGEGLVLLKSYAYPPEGGGRWGELAAGREGVVVAHTPGKLQVAFREGPTLWVPTWTLTNRSYEWVDATGARVRYGAPGGTERVVESPYFRWIPCPSR